MTRNLDCFVASLLAMTGMLICALFPLVSAAEEASAPPAPASAEQDASVPLTAEQTRLLDGIFTFYYLAPSPEKVSLLLDLINTTDLLRAKASQVPVSAFLSKVFAANTEQVFSWMSRNDYNSYAQDVIANALMNAGLKRDALIFAEAHGWNKRALARLESAGQEYDFERMGIYVPGHIDVLWALFSATGEEQYAQRVIDYLFYPAPLPSAGAETRKMAALTAEYAMWSLNSNARRHEKVMAIMEARIAGEADPLKKEILSQVLNPPKPGKAKAGEFEVEESPSPEKE